MYYRVVTKDGQTIERAHRADAERAALLFGGTVEIINYYRILRNEHGAHKLSGRSF